MIILVMMMMTSKEFCSILEGCYMHSKSFLQSRLGRKWLRSVGSFKLTVRGVVTEDHPEPHSKDR